MRRSRAFYACAASRRSTHLPTPTPSSPRGRDATATTAALRGRHFRKQDGGAAAWVSAARVRWRGRGSRAPGPSRAARGGAGRGAREAARRPAPRATGRRQSAAAASGLLGGVRGGARFVRCCGRPRLRQPPRPAAWPRGAAPAGAPVPAARAPVTQLKVFRALAVSGAPGFAGRPAPPPPPLPARFALCGLLQ